MGFAGTNPSAVLYRLLAYQMDNLIAVLRTLLYEIASASERSDAISLL